MGAVKSAGAKAKEKIEGTGVGKKMMDAASAAGGFIADKTKVAAAAVKRQGSKIAVRVLRA